MPLYYLFQDLKQVTVIVGPEPDVPLETRFPSNGCISSASNPVAAT